MICSKEEKTLIRSFIKEYLSPGNVVPGVPYKTSRNIDQLYLRQDFWAAMGVKATMVFAPHNDGRLIIKWRFTDGMTWDEIEKLTGLKADSIRVKINRCLDDAIDELPERMGEWIMRRIGKRHQYIFRACTKCGGGNKPRGTLQREYDEIGKLWEWVCINCGHRTPTEQAVVREAIDNHEQV